MPKTSVILIQNIVGLGGESDLVKVAAGYARNYLIPQGLAVPLTAANKRRIEALRQRRADREAHEFNTMSELAKSISKLVAVIAVKTGEDGKMFGTVTAGMVADQLKTQFDISLDKRKIHLEHPIKTLGEHDLELRLHPEVTATLKLRVESTTPEVIPAAPEAKEGEGKEGKEGARTESRGHRRSREETVAPEGAEKAHRPERKPRTDRPDRPPRSPRPEKAANPAKSEKPEKAEKAEKPE